MFIPAVWKLHVPPRVQVFLWLLSHNKLLTRDNLEKKQNILDKTCLLCSEKEIVNHLFFSCDIMKIMWIDGSTLIGKNLGVNFESIARFWISNQKNVVTNMIVAALMWSTWKH
jgi:hypothetical protein